MESFYDFNSKYTEIFPTATELKKTKQMLISGDKNQILQSVEKIRTFIHCEESLSEIIRSDIPEFLCDAMIPFDPDIVCGLYNCLELMSRHVEFFTHNHSCFAIESLIRTLHFVLKETSCLSNLNQCLNLLNLIVQGYNSYGVTPEKKTVENLLQLLPTLVKNMTPSINSKYQTGVLICSLLELNILKQSQEAHDIILINFSAWYNLLNEILESEHPMREKLILLCCMLSHSVLRYFVSKKNSLDNSEFEINEDLKNEINMNIIEFLINVGAPFVDNIPLSSLENDSSQVENFYQAILCYYSDEITSERNRLTHGLSERGFLQFTTRIISCADFSHGQKLRRLCLLILFHVILYLSEDVFDFPEVWPKGRNDFRSEVQQGIAQLPVDASQWLDILVSPAAPFCCKLAILLYLYFYAMTAKSQEVLRGIYPSIVFFIHVTKGIESSVILLKIVWFVFVMCQLSLAQSTALDNGLEATDEMVALLETQEDLSLLYTHHPALLYWAFSSRVSNQIQTQTVHLWLRNKTPDCRELDELMRHSSDVQFAVLDIIQNGCGQELDSAFSSLKSLLSDSDDLAASLWFLLPQALAKFTTDSTPAIVSAAVNVDYVIELCSVRTPRNLDMAKVIRIAFLLPEVFLKSDLISVMPSLSLTLQLLQVAAQMEDNRVLFIFLRHNGFIGKILEGINSNASDISHISLKIITILWKECEELKIAENRQKIEISKDIILSVLDTNCENVITAGLDLLQQILVTSFQSPIFEIINVDLGFLEILFLQIQNICVKGTSEISEKCWQCLTFFLTVEFSEIEGAQNELVTHPLLHELIRSYLPLSQREPLPTFRRFLTKWVHLNDLVFGDPCFGRKLFGEFYADTLCRVRRTLAEGCVAESPLRFSKTFESDMRNNNNEEEIHWR